MSQEVYAIAEEKEKKEENNRAEVREEVTQLIKYEGELEKSRNIILNKLLEKISSLEGYTKRLTEIEKELRDLFSGEKGKEAREILEFLSKSSKGDLEKIASIVEKAMSAQEKGEVIPTSELELERLGERIKKMREMGLIDISDEELDNVKIVLDRIGKAPEGHFEFLSKISKEKIEESLNRIDSQIKIDQKYGYTDDEIERLREDLIILKWFLKPDERVITVPREKLEKIREEEKEGIYKKITLKDIEEIEELTELNTRLLFHTGCELLRRRKFKTAYENFDYITKINNNLRGAWLNKGIALGSMDKYEEEINCYDKALELDENYASARYNKGIALKNLKRDDEAEECFEKAKEINPEFSNLVERSS